MRQRVMWMVGFLLLTLIVGCVPSPPVEAVVVDETAVSSPNPTATSANVPSPEPPDEPARETIVIPIVIYILDDLDGQLSSQRTEAEIEQIFERVNTIWAQADIELDLLRVERVAVPRELLLGFNNREFGRFFTAVNQGQVTLPEFAPIVGFYVQTLGGPNGIAPSLSNTFFVMDTPSVLDERVTSHEIGHILGLHHVLDDAERLMFSGTNGMNLTEEEATVTRYAARGLLVGLR